MILPGFGIISHIVSTFSRKPVFGYMAMAYAMVAIGFVGSSCWPTTCTHHGHEPGRAQRYFVAATMVIAVPTGVKIFSWMPPCGRFDHLQVAHALGYRFIFLFTVGV